MDVQLLKRETPLEGIESDMFRIVNEGPARCTDTAALIVVVDSG